MTDGLAKLSPRQRQCLSLVYERRTSKEIAAALGIDPSTVDSYIAEAIRLIGARNRRDAAERLVAAGHGWDQPAATPSNLGDEESRVDLPQIAPPSLGGPEAHEALLRLPFRRRGAAHNELNTIERFAWLPVAAIALATGFGMLVVGLRVLGDLLSSIGALAR